MTQRAAVAGRKHWRGVNMKIFMAVLATTTTTVIFWNAQHSRTDGRTDTGGDQEGMWQNARARARARTRAHARACAGGRERRPRDEAAERARAHSDDARTQSAPPPPTDADYAQRHY